MKRYLMAGIMLALVSTPGVAIAGKADDNLNIVYGGEVSSLDVYKESSREGTVLARLIYDSLLHKDFATGEITGELATSYKFVDDRTIELELRRGIKFHNGDAFTADDVVFTLNMLASKDYEVKYRQAIDWIEKAEKIDDFKVRITSKTPYPLALEMLAGNIAIYPKAYYSAVGSKGMSVKPVGTGPYRLVSMTPGTGFVFERFDGYYPDSPKGKAQINKITVRVLPEPNTQYAALLNGQADWIWRLPPSDAKNLGRTAGIDINNVQLIRFSYIGINPHFENDKSPLANVKVRQALNYAIDRLAIAKNLVGGASEAIDAPCAPIQFGCSGNIARYAYNPAKAKALLTEAGYASGFPLEITVVSTPSDQAQAVAANLEAVGIKVKLNTQQYAPGVTAWRDGKAALFMLNIGSFGIADIGIGAGPAFNGGADDTAKDQEVVELFRQSDMLVDKAARKVKLEQAIAKITSQSYGIPLWTYNLITASRGTEYGCDA